MAELPNVDVDVTVDISPMALPRRGLNIGMILTNSTSVIETTTRCKFYATLAEMIDDGFMTINAEYLAAQAYFAQEGNLGASIPGVYIGVWDEAGETETITDALIACRAVTADWYGFALCFITDDTSVASLAATTQILQPASRYFLVKDDSNIRDNVTNNLFAQIKALNYYRTIMTWNENPAVFGAALLGLTSGLTSDLAGSAYTLKFKQLTGQAPSILTSGQVNNIEGNNGNVYVQRARAQYEQGVNADGSWFDEWLYMDKLVNEIQIGIYDLLYSERKIPQTEDGHNAIAGVISQACEKQVNTGFLAPGVWRRNGIINLQRGDFIAAGYLIQWAPVDEQTDADRAARKAQPFYVALTLAGAIHSVLVQLSVSR